VKKYILHKYTKISLICEYLTLITDIIKDLYHLILIRIDI